MLRVHFTTADAMRVRVVVLGVVAELQLSFTKLCGPGTGVVFDAWRARTARQARSLNPDVHEVARFLVPPRRGMVDLFTLLGAVDSYAEGIDRLRELPRGPLWQEFSYSPAITGVRTSWIDDVARGDRAAQDRFTGALSAYHSVAVAPYWPRIRTVLENERAARVDIMARHGLAAMLASLAPTVRWQPPVLEVPGYVGAHAGTPYPVATDVELRGRGLVLAPSLFTRSDPGLYLPWNDDPALLIYPLWVDPVAAAELWRPGDAATDRALSGLLGTTRAAALETIAQGCTTSELARRLGISPGGASQHASILREAGLVVSRRHRNTVRHTVTRLGRDLLNAG